MFLVMTKATVSFQLKVIQGFLEELMQSVTKVVMVGNYITTLLQVRVW